MSAPLPEPPAVWPLAAFPLGDDAPGAIRYGPAGGDEAALRLLGALDGRRVLVLGCGGGGAAVTLARAGARVIAVDAGAEAVAEAQRVCASAGVKVELAQRDLAELAFVRADSIDVALCIYAIAGVRDLARLFRQVHRVLRQGSGFVFSLPHPALSFLDDAGAVVRPYWGNEPRPWTLGERRGVDYGYTASELFTALSRANFRVDALLEPPPAPDAAGPYLRPIFASVPSTLVLRARKVGS
ncbi:MAG: class I SAM-dependent methyltransferase [Acidimicrobiales bacterium]